MEQFDFHQDHKETVWRRQYFTIEAETLEEAKAKALEISKNDLYIDNDNWETLYDTFEGLRPEDNDGWATRELYQDDDLLFSNSKIGNEK